MRVELIRICTILSWFLVKIIIRSAKNQLIDTLIVSLKTEKITNPIDSKKAGFEWS